MALRLATERPGLINAVCAISANMPTAVTYSCGLDGPTFRVMLIADTKDPISPYEGGNVSLFGLKRIGTAPSTLTTAKSIAQRNYVMDKPLSSNIKELAMKDGTTV